jgi:hypothetical protein
MAYQLRFLARTNFLTPLEAQLHDFLCFPKDFQLKPLLPQNIPPIHHSPSNASVSQYKVDELKVSRVDPKSYSLFLGRADNVSRTRLQPP